MKGLALPIAGQGGRTITTDGEDQLTKIIAAALSDGDSDNPFQDLGNTNDFVFTNQDEITQAHIRLRIKTIFARLQADKRAKLATGYPKFKSTNGSQELVCEILYINMETTDPTTLELGFDPSGLARVLNEG